MLTYYLLTHLLAFFLPSFLTPYELTYVYHVQVEDAQAELSAKLEKTKQVTLTLTLTLTLGNSNPNLVINGQAEPAS